MSEDAITRNSDPAPNDSTIHSQHDGDHGEDICAVAEDLFGSFEWDGELPSNDDGVGHAGDMPEPDDASRDPQLLETAQAAIADAAEPSAAMLHRIAGPSTNKAGLESVDKLKVSKIIYDISKGSKFFRNEERKDAELNKRIERLLQQRDALSEREIKESEARVDDIVKELEASERILDQWIVHIDMDAYFASVEELDRPELRDQPMAVGGISMLSTANYVARKFGVRSAMPGYIAMNLCKELVILPPRYDRYRELAERVRTVLKTYDEHFCAAGLDESFLNLTNYVNNNNVSVEDAVRNMREAITQETHLTASAGIAANKRLAKICSDFNKPNGQFFLERDREVIMDFMARLPARKISGVGRVTEQVLAALGVQTCSDIIEQRGKLKLLLSDISFRFLIRMALGLGSTDVDVDWTRKSMSVERTFSAVSDPTQLAGILRDLCGMLSADMDSEDIKGRTVSIKLKRVDFKSFTRAKSLRRSVHTPDDLYTYTMPLLEAEFPVSLRLLGVRISGLCGRDQPNLPDISEYFSSKASNTESTPSIPLSHGTAERVQCPVCSKVLGVDATNAEINAHLDICLNRRTVSSMAPGSVTSVKRKRAEGGSEVSGIRKFFRSSE